MFLQLASRQRLLGLGIDHLLEIVAGFEVKHHCSLGSVGLRMWPRACS